LEEAYHAFASKSQEQAASSRLGLVPTSLAYEVEAQSTFVEALAEALSAEEWLKELVPSLQAPLPREP